MLPEAKTFSDTKSLPFLPFSKPTIEQEEIDEVIACLQSGWIATGPRVQQFENDLKAYLPSPHVFAVTSATGGLYIVLKALHLEKDEEIITTPLTFVASLNSIVLAGGKPVLVDIDPTTYNIDPTLIEKAITPKTRGILPVHFAGLSCDLDPIYNIARKHNLFVLEDAAQAIGTEYKNKKIGSFGDFQVFSFHPNKNITTIEGGAISLPQESSNLKRLSPLRFHGIDRDMWDRFTKKGSQQYDVNEPALKFNMSDVQAALGIHQLKKLDSFIKKRTSLAQRYLNLLNGWEELELPPHNPNYIQRHAWHLFAPCLNTHKTNINRLDLISLMKEKGIGVGLHYEPAHLYSFYQNTYGYKKGDFPHAEWVGERIFSLPLFPLMTKQDQDRVVMALAEIFGRKE